MLDYTLKGWPSQVSKELQPYHTKLAELSVEEGCLLWGRRVIIPKKLQKTILKELHSKHMGVAKMKALEDLWNLETIGIVEPLDITDDDRALEQFNKSVCFENERYYITSLGSMNTLIFQQGRRTVTDNGSQLHQKTLPTL